MGRGTAELVRTGRKLPLACATLGAMLATLFVWGAAGGQDQRFVHERWMSVQGPTGELERVYAVFPFRVDRKDHLEEARYPLVLALHGRAESQKGPVRGPRGWVLDYELPAAFGALGRGEVTREDYRGLVDAAHLRAVNAELEARGFGGAMVAAPFVPDLMADDPPVSVEAYTAWLAGPLLDQLRDEFPGAAHGRESVGIDGVSLGGWLALEAGLSHPEVFGAVGAIQPAIGGREQALAERAVAVRREGVTQPIRLLTSREDPNRRATERLSDLLREGHVPHDLVVLPGPHDYVFNQGPGSMELLRFHGAVLKREPLPDAPAP